MCKTNMLMQDDKLVTVSSFFHLWECHVCTVAIFRIKNAVVNSGLRQITRII